MTGASFTPMSAETSPLTSNIAASAVLLVKSRKPTPASSNAGVCRLPVGPYTAFVDAADFERVRLTNWFPDVRSHTIYAKAHARRIEFGKTTKTTVYLHRFIMDAPPDLDVDHGDRDGLNCCRYNLECVPHPVNLDRQPLKRQSSTGYHGVTRAGQKFRVQVCAPSKVRGRRSAIIEGGVFTCMIAAAKAYDALALQLLGSRARLNFPEPV